MPLAPRPLEGEPQQSGRNTRQMLGVGDPVLLLTRPLLRLPFCEHQPIPPCASVDTELLLQGNDSCPYPASGARKWTQRNPSE